MKWLPFELHTHTPHSDGTHTLLEMCRKAKEMGYSGIALTDHNTTSGMVDAAAVTAETGIIIVPGLEWTTFYGHMLTLGIPYSEWRDLGPGDIHKGIERVHNQGGIVGIAHPFSLGSPICTGCHWEYEIKDWNEIDYMEVWHETLPPMRNHNAPAFEQWTQLLNQGYRISGTAGRDWHVSTESDDPPAYTYLGVPEEGEVGKEQVVEAIRSGRICVSMGPRLELHIKAGEQQYSIGDVIPALHGKGEEVELSVSIHSSMQENTLLSAGQPLMLIVESNLGELTRSGFSEDLTEFHYTMTTEGLLWLRVRLRGMLGGALSTVAFTNPIYFDERSEGHE
ncbi:CehA/McbA family metallohydrolase [Paenibacillus sp. GCM10012306]|uniref:CehA/McbA family metallohydrolase n=1 Tax=Paenibacillus sp. GCM10012306 TaxID=3317342 RepID=UPI0036097816